MNTKPKQLNEKIAEWLGWARFKNGWRMPGGFFSYELPTHSGVPNFTASTDTHGPIIEKLEEKYYVTIEYLLFSDWVQCNLKLTLRSDPADSKANEEYNSEGLTQSAAFCLAVEKIIDEEQE